MAKECDFCGKKLLEDIDEIHERRSTICGETIIFVSCDNEQCRFDLANRV